MLGFSSTCISANYSIYFIAKSPDARVHGCVLVAASSNYSIMTGVGLLQYQCHLEMC